jgi:Zn finger protein HypA/HybF involved in hydrogenase expression
MPRQPVIHKLFDEYGEYRLRITCAKCRNVRQTAPYPLANKFGWNMTLEQLRQRLRCSHCGAKDAVIDISPPNNQ